MLLHVVAEHLAKPLQQSRLVGGDEHFQRVTVHVEHAYLAHAAGDEFRMHVGEDAEIADAAAAGLIQQLLDAAEILHPQRHRRMLEQPARIFLAERELAARSLARGHILDGEEDARPVVLISGQDAALQLQVEPPAGERVIHRIAVEFALSAPELRELLDMRLRHVVAEDHGEVRHQMRQVLGFEEGERLAVHLDDADAIGAGLHAPEVAQKVRPDVADSCPPPFFEQGSNTAEILQPEGDRSAVEHLRVVARLVLARRSEVHLRIPCRSIESKLARIG